MKTIYIVELDCPYCKSPYSYRPKDICHKIADEYEQKGW